MKQSLKQPSNQKTKPSALSSRSSSSSLQPASQPANLILAHLLFFYIITTSTPLEDISDIIK
jgi:hypothetical protein